MINDGLVSSKHDRASWSEQCSTPVWLFSCSDNSPSRRCQHFSSLPRLVVILWR